MKNIKIALLCFDNPFLKPFEGGKRGILSRIKSLMLFPNNYSIDLYLLTKRNEGTSADCYSKKTPINNVYQFKMRKMSIDTMFSKFPICVNKRFVSDCIKTLSQNHYDIAIYEGLQIAKYRFKRLVNAEKHILYFHDIESNYRRQLSGAFHGPKKIANIFESVKFKWMEKKAPNLFDQFWFVSCDESEYYASQYHLNNCTYIPYPVDIANQISLRKNKEEKSLLYVGDLSLPNNYESIKWFMERCYPIVKKQIQNVSIEVIGKISEKNKNLLSSLGAIVYGYVDNLCEWYEKCTAVICPVIFGAGVKIKTLDSLSKGKIVITTTKGIEGTQLKNDKHLFVRDNAEEFADICVSVLTEEDKYFNIAENGFYYVKFEHSIKKQYEIMKSELKKMGY